MYPRHQLLHAQPPVAPTAAPVMSRVNQAALNPFGQVALREQQAAMNQAALQAAAAKEREREREREKKKVEEITRAEREKERKKIEEFARMEKKKREDISREKRCFEDAQRIAAEMKANEIATQNLFFKAFNKGPQKVDESKNIPNKPYTPSRNPPVPTQSPIIKRKPSGENLLAQPQSRQPAFASEAVGLSRANRGINSVFENSRSEREKKQRERNALVLAAEGARAKAPKPFQVLSAVPYAKVEPVNRGANRNPSLEAVQEACNELSMLLTSDGQCKRRDSDRNRATSSSTESDGGSAMADIDNRLWLGGLAEKMGALQQQVQQQPTNKFKKQNKKTSPTRLTI